VGITRNWGDLLGVSDCEELVGVILRVSDCEELDGGYASSGTSHVHACMQD